MEFRKVLTESYPRYILTYKGTRPEYKIHDPKPYVLVLDQNYNPDDKGESILGINLNYYNGDVNKLIRKINSFDNKSGYMGFEGRLKVKRFLKQDGITEWEVDKRNKRYKSLIKEFPELKQYIRRYKKQGPKGTGIQDQQRKIF